MVCKEASGTPVILLGERNKDEPRERVPSAKVGTVEGGPRPQASPDTHGRPAESPGLLPAGAEGTGRCCRDYPVQEPGKARRGGE